MKPIAAAALAAFVNLGLLVPAFAQMPDVRIPPGEAVAAVRSMGFAPFGAPALRGNVYVLRAVDEDDLPVRVLIDARSGAVVGVRAAPTVEPGFGGWRERDASEDGLVPPRSVPPRRDDLLVAPSGPIPKPLRSAQVMRPAPKPAAPRASNASPAPSKAAIKPSTPAGSANPASPGLQAVQPAQAKALPPQWADKSGTAEKPETGKPVDAAQQPNPQPSEPPKPAPVNPLL